MKFRHCSVDGVYLIEPEPRSDARGRFERIWCEREIGQQGLEARIAQVNVQVSPRAGTLRGLHFQDPPHQEVKIVRCNRGRVFDVAVDLRPASPTWRRWFGVTLSAESGALLYVPAGCAHGYLTLEPDSEVLYFASTFYAPQAARGLRYDDPAIGIRWPMPPELVSDADRSWPHLEEERQ